MASATARVEDDASTSADAISVDLIESLGIAIRDRRIALPMSQEELAVRSGLHRTYLSDVERGARNPSIKTIEKIAQALQVPVVKLFEECRALPKTK